MPDLSLKVSTDEPLDVINDVFDQKSMPNSSPPHGAITKIKTGADEYLTNSKQGLGLGAQFSIKALQALDRLDRNAGLGRQRRLLHSQYGAARSDLFPG